MAGIYNDVPNSTVVIAKKTTKTRNKRLVLEKLVK